MTKYLPPNLLSLFFPRDPIEFKQPVKTRKRPNDSYSGVGSFLDCFDLPTGETPAPTPFENAQDRRERKGIQKMTKIYKGTHIRHYSFADCFDVTEDQLKKEFERYGEIRRIRVVTDVRTLKPRGYAFIEYAHEKDMKSAYKKTNGLKMNGRRILTDVERGRTDKHWLPMYLGGGLGGEKRRKSNRSPSKRSESREPKRSRSREKRNSSKERDKKEKSRRRSTSRETDRSERKRRHEDRDGESRRSDRKESKSKHSKSEKSRKRSRIDEDYN